MDIREKISSLEQEIDSTAISSTGVAEELRIKWLGKKGSLTALFEEFRDVPPEFKRELGQRINLLREKANEKITQAKNTHDENDVALSTRIDLTLPAVPIAQNGTRHPISITRNKIVEIFSRIGFTVSDGREIEDDWHNFSALNTPENHPARDMQDTFYVQTDPAIVLRTQTSSVQVHIMEHQQPPIRTISPGRVYRNEAISARAHCQFHQVEGLYIDKKVSFADLKQTLLYFSREMFGAETKIRLRPSFFPFTEPSAEMDISCTLCKSEGCNVCKHKIGRAHV